MSKSEPVKVTNHPTVFGGYRHCGIEDVMVLVCHVISHNHVIKESCDLIGGSPSR